MWQILLQKCRTEGLKQTCALAVAAGRAGRCQPRSRGKVSRDVSARNGDGGCHLHHPQNKSPSHASARCSPRLCCGCSSSPGSRARGTDHRLCPAAGLCRDPLLVLDTPICNHYFFLLWQHNTR